MKKGDVIFFEGLVYKVTETPTDPANQDKRVSKLGHFRAEGKRGEKRPTVESHPKHLQPLTAKAAQEEVDAEQGQWVASYAQERDPALKKALLALCVANAREAALEVKKVPGTFAYLSGRLILPPVPRPDLSGGAVDRERRARKGLLNNG